MTVEVAMVMTLTICGNGGNAGKMIMLEVLITVMLVNRRVVDDDDRGGKQRL